MGILLFLVYFLIAAVLLFLTIILGGEAPWYFAWVVGTLMIVLASAASGAFLDMQETVDHDE